VPETDVATVVAAQAAGPITIVDVREPDEWRGGHIAGAKHIPLGDLPRRATEVDASRPVVTVCRSGRRSLDAVRILQAAGVADVKSMAGGMIAWQEAKQPVAR
jgi:rhodanese-related sulfurtransferase